MAGGKFGREWVEINRKAGDSSAARRGEAAAGVEGRGSDFKLFSDSILW
jgi:hypothetical protein